MRILNTREQLLNLLPKGSIGAEIGIFKGDFSRKILEVVQPSKFYMVDLFKGIVRSGDKDGQNIEVINYDNYFVQIIADFDLPNVEIIKGTSNDIPERLDWVYIDADHSYKGVQADLRALHGKINKGGWIMGHDYTSRTEGVIRAVSEYCEKYGYKIVYLTKDGCPSFAIQIW